MEKSSIPDRTTSLRHFMTIVFKRLWIIAVVALLALAAGSMKVLRTPDYYRAQSKLLLERDPELEKALLLRVSSSGRTGEASYSYTQESEIMTSRPVLESVIRALKLYSYADTTIYKTQLERGIAMQEAVIEVSSRLSISPSPDPNIIKVRYKSTDPQLAADVVNVIVEHYINYRFTIFSDDQSIAFLDRQMEETAQRLNDLTQRRADFQKDGTLYSPDREGQLLFNRLSDYEDRADAVRLDRISKESRLRALRNLVNNGSYDELPAIDMGEDNVRTKGIFELKDQLRTLEYERDYLRQKYTDSYVEVQDKNAEIKALTNRINDGIIEYVTVLESSITALSNEESILRRSVTNIRTEIRSLSGKELELQKLSRGITENEELYSVLIKQREEARLSQSKKEMVVRVKVISPAVVPIDPVATNRPLKLMMVLFFGIFAGISLAFFIDFFDHSFKNAEDVQRYLDLDTLASIRSF
ncbi:hypothetical protein CEE37_02975 [candidate division LCP-89 bacterium B3_LCP]|uniref:Tyrosine kinase G-rich domain-containing protein n=1 Tax=candidate division LCP-89 bacterium B3_LCP TaxID=2012998 RepID=A0A532V338_UNCL8|nr:MAG: hypothetical protein CEE37_02975 [candidate division LCP-89 bacterium B3_LCP]